MARGVTDGVDLAGQYGPSPLRERYRKPHLKLLMARAYAKWRGVLGVKGVAFALKHRLRAHVRAWGIFVRSGGFARGEVLDEHEMLFGLLDPSPARRIVDRGSLRQFLLEG